MNPGNSVTGGGLFALVIVGLVGWLIYHQVTKTDYAKPWWNGTALQRVCEIPYYDNSECYNLYVSSDGENVLSVRFNNGGYINFDDSDCDKGSGSQGVTRLCNLYEDGQRTWQAILVEG